MAVAGVAPATAVESSLEAGVAPVKQTHKLGPSPEASSGATTGGSHPKNWYRTIEYAMQFNPSIMHLANAP